MEAAADGNITIAKRNSSGYSKLIAEADGNHLRDFDDSAWEEKTLPAVENQLNEYPTVPEFYKDGVWYRRSFEVEANDSGKFAQLVFPAVNLAAAVWINGEYIGQDRSKFRHYGPMAQDFFRFGE